MYCVKNNIYHAKSDSVEDFKFLTHAIIFPISDRRYVGQCCPLIQYFMTSLICCNLTGPPGEVLNIQNILKYLGNYN